MKILRHLFAVLHELRIVLESRLVTANSFYNQHQFHVAVVDEMEIELSYGMTPTSF